MQPIGRSRQGAQRLRAVQRGQDRLQPPDMRQDHLNTEISVAACVRTPRAAGWVPATSLAGRSPICRQRSGSRSSASCSAMPTTDNVSPALLLSDHLSRLGRKSLAAVPLATARQSIQSWPCLRLAWSRYPLPVKSPAERRMCESEPSVGQRERITGKCGGYAIAGYWRDRETAARA